MYCEIIAQLCIERGYKGDYSLLNDFIRRNAKKPMKSNHNFKWFAKTQLGRDKVGCSMLVVVLLSAYVR
jgi:hypothetical protein